ncbi:unnamed protein product [Nippostrongylus brasiliensis]|uniref:Keratin n=1 Tax=Nippostrongylus brasiliensis TaxID=27835 RepID=A0A0N4YPB0_NIPBR|nr:unnamed protein product [Nippostrongylus brasiliensis]
MPTPTATTICLTTSNASTQLIIIAEFADSRVSYQPEHVAVVVSSSHDQPDQFAGPPAFKTMRRTRCGQCESTCSQSCPQQTQAPQCQQQCTQLCEPVCNPTQQEFYPDIVDLFQSKTQQGLTVTITMSQGALQSSNCQSNCETSCNTQCTQQSQPAAQCAPACSQSCTQSCQPATVSCQRSTASSQCTCPQNYSPCGSSQCCRK